MARRSGSTRHEVREAAGDEVVHDAEADAGAQRLELRHRARAFEIGRRAVVELAHVVERGRKRVLLDIADQPMAPAVASTSAGAPLRSR